MARELKPATRAINAGIGERIQELGFRRKSGRLYLREDERFAEYVIFRSDGLKFYDRLGIFDKDFEAFMVGLPHRGSNVSDKPRPCHVFKTALGAWRRYEQREEFRLDDRITLIRPWTIIWPGLKLMRKPESKKTPFTTDDGDWLATENWEGCAALSLEKFEEYVVPWRERTRTDKIAFMDEYSGYSRGGQAQHMCALAYSGRWEAVREMVEVAYAEMNEPPPKGALDNFKAHDSKDPEKIEAWIAANLASQADLAVKLENLAATLEARRRHSV
jgi:hypothetical protein